MRELYKGRFLSKVTTVGKKVIGVVTESYPMQLAITDELVEYTREVEVGIVDGMLVAVL